MKMKNEVMELGMVSTSLRFFWYTANPIIWRKSGENNTLTGDKEIRYTVYYTATPPRMCYVNVGSTRFVFHIFMFMLLMKRSYLLV